MTICFDLSAAAHERAGLGRYAANLARALLPLIPDLNVFINDPRESHLRPPLSALPSRTARLPRKLWRLRAAVSYLGGPPLDQVFPKISLFHATEHLLPKITGVRSVFTLHDVAYLRFPQHHLPQNRWYLTLMMPRFLARADRIIAVSEHTRRDALQFYRLPPEKVVVIPEGVEPQFAPAQDDTQLNAVRQKYALPKEFILYVGTLEPRKNLALLLEAYAALRPRHPETKLVMVGGKGWLYKSFFAHLRRLGLESEVVFTGYIPEKDLPTVLNCATVFAFPSVFEGFGLPPLEAMACGVPVICSNAASLPEVVGEAGLLLSPQDQKAWVEALNRVLTDVDLRADLRARGLERARRFTWENAAQKTLAVYKTSLNLKNPLSG